MGEEEEALQTKSGKQVVPSQGTEHSLGSSKGNGSPLSKSVKNEMESGFGVDFSNVNIHTDSKAVQMNKELGAQAFTHGKDIYFNKGKYNPSSKEGKHLLAHELTHTIQQTKNIKRKESAGFNVQDKNLQSDLLSGNPTLENCLDAITSSYVRYGARGLAVELVQNALIDLGFPLPKFGADGIFLDETLAAIHQFQKLNALSADGIIGTLTIDQIDQSHAGFNKQPPEKTKPIPDIPVPGTVPETCNSNGENKNTLLDGLSVSAPPTIQAKHLSIDDSLNIFTDHINADIRTVGDKKVTELGQFYWSGIVKGRMKKIIRDNTTSLIDPLKNDLEELIDISRAAARSGDQQLMFKKIVEIEEKLVKRSGTASNNLRKLLVPSNSTVQPSGLWNKFNKINEVPPEVDKMINVHDYFRLFKIEKTTCVDVASFMIRRFKKRGGHSKIDPDKKRSPQNSIPLPGKSISNTALRHFKWNGNKTKGDVVNYGANLSSVVERMKKALDDGFLIQAGAVSGTNFKNGLAGELVKSRTMKNPPDPKTVSGAQEHSLVIIGYDGNEFIFWDPDSSASNGHGEQGFGSLFFENGRLTTARNDNDLFVNDSGNHLNGNKRYQILGILTG